jgi:hypothetical protein
VSVDRFLGGSLDATFENDGAGNVTVTVVIVRRDGSSATLVFTVDTAAGDAVSGAS